MVRTQEARCCGAAVFSPWGWSPPLEARGRLLSSFRDLMSHKEGRRLLICPATGHAVNDPVGPFCGDHGARMFSDCPACGSEWSRTWEPRGEKGTDFCAQCGNPAPWLSRTELIQWLKACVQATDLEPAKRRELQEALDRIAELAPDDTKTAAGWDRLRAVAPRVWELAKPVINVLIGEGVRKMLRP